MNSALRRLLVPLLRSVQEGKPISFRMKSAAGQALFLVQRKPSPSRKAPAKARKIAKATAHQEETGAIREAVVQRAGGDCELFPVVAHGGSDMHHLEGGSGRRALQKVSNCMWVCRGHHDSFHQRPEDYRAEILGWCAKHGYPTPRRFLRPAREVEGSPPSPSAPSRGKEET